MPADSLHETPTFGAPNRERGTYTVELPEASQETKAAAMEALVVEVDALQAKNLEYENRIAQLEAILRDTREPAEVQPRRVRQRDGVTEQYVKYKNGSHISYDWEAVKEKPKVDEVTAGWDEFTKQRDAGMFKDIKPGTRVDSLSQLENDEQEDTSTPNKPPLPEISAQEAAEQYAAKATQNQAEVTESSTEEEANPDQEPKAFEVAIDKELEARLVEARDTYAKLSAKNRNGYQGHYLSNSRFLAKIPFLKDFADKQNEKHDAKELGPAREAYRNALKDLQEKIRELCIAEYGETEEAMKQSLYHSIDQISTHELAFEATLANTRQELSGESNKFADWWVRQDTFLRRVGKYAVVAGVALPIGIVAGLAGAPVVAAAGIIAGGALGAGMGAYATKKRASAETREGGVLADVQKHADMNEKSTYIDGQQASNQFTDVDKLIDITEARTGQEKTSNRMRVKGAGAAGVAGAAVGVSIGGAIRSGIDSIAQGVDGGDTNGTEGGKDSNKLVEPEAPKPPEFQAETFGVEAGNGYTHELIDFAQANGHELPVNESWELHKALVDQFGANYIDIAGQAQDTYNLGGGNYNIGLNGPGEATWNPGVADFIKNWMTAKGLW